MKKALFFPAVLVVFTASGFAGLIYESIWSHYLKLFLGHAAYAQTLVLAIFMGGMALGAWACSRVAHRWRNLLFAYGVIEALVGAASLAFHPVFVATTDFAFDRAIPALEAPAAITAFKWLLGAALVLPQSVLLGMTFPLMTAGVLRAQPERSGRSIALLYFTNSLGAGVGVLASGFYFIPYVGLPGALTGAAVVNLTVGAAAVILGAAARARAPVAQTSGGAAAAPGGTVRLLLWVAALTGASSFVYEIAWIRMLSLVLGSSTHAFEIMLSAFILGLAFGGFWVRKRIDTAGASLRFLGGIQVAMGIAALATLPVYASSFQFMDLVLRTLSLSESGYVAFNLLSHGISLAVMFPAAFCAGMTLPLITAALLRAGSGERVIGQVYAANTAGGIVGVFAAVHIGFGLLGLKGLVIAGAAVDLALGAVLLGAMPGRRRFGLAFGASALSLAVLLAAGLGVTLSAHDMASGVFQRQGLLDREKVKVLAHIDGKTSTVSVTATKDQMAVHNNGKSDGALSVNEDKVGADDVTMVLAGALPVLLDPQARRVANIGFGTGMTAHVLLGSPKLEALDTIEIEPAVVEGARLLLPHVARAYEDPRSRLHYDDAKTFFSSRRRRYDVIVSEPSNPWVSGVSSLFSAEFYRHARRHLRESGLLVQWVQMYDFSMPLLASVVAALQGEFSDYALWAPNDGDLIIVAANGGRVPRPAAAALEYPEIAAALARIRIRSLEDLRLHEVGRREVMEPYFASFGAQPNSDYFPVVDSNAAKARYLRLSATGVLALADARFPVLALFAGSSPPDPAGIDAPPPAWRNSTGRPQEAKAVAAFLGGAAPLSAGTVHPSMQADFALLRAALVDCRLQAPAGVLRGALADLAVLVNGHLPREQAELLWRRLQASPCAAALPVADRRWLELHAAVAARDVDAMGRIAEAVLAADDGLPSGLCAQAVAALMGGHVLAGRGGRAMQAFQAHRACLAQQPEWQPVFSFLVAHAATARRAAGQH
jgi:spermidine synthase